MIITVQAWIGCMILHLVFLNQDSFQSYRSFINNKTTLTIIIIKQHSSVSDWASFLLSSVNAAPCLEPKTNIVESTTVYSMARRRTLSTFVSGWMTPFPSTFNRKRQANIDFYSLLVLPGSLLTLSSLISQMSKSLTRFVAVPVILYSSFCIL